MRPEEKEVIITTAYRLLIVLVLLVIVSLVALAMGATFVAKTLFILAILCIPLALLSVIVYISQNRKF